VKFGKRVELRATKESKISIGADVVISDRCIIQAGELVVIGTKAEIGACCLIMDRNHHGLGKVKTITLNPTLHNVVCGVDTNAV